MKKFTCRVLEYEMRGNDEDGWDCDNVYEIALVTLRGDYHKLTDKQILKRLHNKPCHKTWNQVTSPLKFDFRSIEIDNNNMSDNLILIVAKSGKPLGEIRLEEVDDGKDN